MKEYRADLHIHTVLSPCASLEMSPACIVEKAIEKEIDIIAITDHNHTAHNRITRDLALEKGLVVLYGTEISSIEEIHCLSYFETEDQVREIQSFIDDNITRTRNIPAKLGYQPVINSEEMIEKYIEHSLYGSVQKSIEEICTKVHGLGGLFVPAHVDRSSNSIYSQLGFLPEGLVPDAIEISRRSDNESVLHGNPELMKYRILNNSDAHYPDDIGSAYTIFRMEGTGLREIKMALEGKERREVVAA